MRLVFLHRRALCRAVAAKDAAVAWQWANQNMAGLAFAEKQAGVRGHFKLGSMATIRACQSRACLDLVTTGGGSYHLVLSLLRSGFKRMLLVRSFGTEHIFAHQLAGTVQAAFDSAGLLVKTLGNLGDGQFLKVAQQHHFQVVGRQRFEGGSQVNAQIVVAFARELALGQIVIQRVVAEHGALQLSAFALDDGEKPGRKSGGGLEPVNLARDDPRSQDGTFLT